MCSHFGIAGHWPRPDVCVREPIGVVSARPATLGAWMACGRTIDAMPLFRVVFATTHLPRMHNLGTVLIAAITRPVYEAPVQKRTFEQKDEGYRKWSTVSV